jgi:zinc protease
MKYSLALGLACAAMVPLFAGDDKKDRPPVERFRLDNGLRVHLRPVAGAKFTALVLLYDVGGDHDPAGRSGLAHVVEHLYCTAAAGDVPARSFADIVQRYPRGQNFQTGDRYTVLATVFAPSETERELKEAAARMGDLRPAAEDLARELPRIDEELRNMFAGIPALAAANRARELVRPTPEGGRKGGRMEHINAMTLDELKQRWRDCYRPDNAVLVVAGAVDVPATRKAIEKSFGKLARAGKLPAVHERGKAAAGRVEEVAVKSIVAGAESTFAVAYRAPAPMSEMYAPFLVLVARLIQERAKLEPDAKHFPIVFAPLDDPEVLTFRLKVGDKDGTKELLKRVQEFVAAAAKAEVTAGDQQRTALLFARQLGTSQLPDALLAEDPYGVAFALGRQEQLAIDPTALAKALQAVTTEQVQRAAREVLGESRGGAVLVWVK